MDRRLRVLEPTPANAALVATNGLISSVALEGRALSRVVVTAIATLVDRGVVSQKAPARDLAPDTALADPPDTMNGTEQDSRTGTTR